MTDKKNTPAEAAEIAGAKARSAARSAAATRLRENHREEHDQILVEEMKERGVDWQPRPSKEQKAKAEIERLSREFNIDLAEIASVDAGDVAYTEPTDG